ncbi:MAG: oxidoreductase [Alphaproteobacteria bacterium]|nr:oxidoreductase [Alphaproteobacteria bacterium]
MSNLSRRNFIIAASASLAGVPAARADGEGTILSVHGATSKRNNEAWKFKLAELQAIGREELQTKTPWDGDETAYAGISLQTLYHYVGGFGSILRLAALNDFKSTIPVSDLKQFNPLMAWERNGKLMPIAEKGPLFIVYPFTQKPELWNEEVFAKCVWQLADIEIGD